MATQSKGKRVIGKVLAVVLCATLLISSYTGFFEGMVAYAGSLSTAGLEAGEVGLAKDVTQSGSVADIRVETAAKPVEITEIIREETEAILDAVIIIDTSGSMGFEDSQSKKIIDQAKAGAISIADRIYEMNSENRVAIGSFAEFAYAYAKSDVSTGKRGTITAGGTVPTGIDASNGTDYFFNSDEQSTLEGVINSLSAVGGTNTEGGFLVADKLAECSLSSAGDDRSTLVIFLTDGLPTGRYDGTSATYDGNGEGLPNYYELTEMLAAAEATTEVTDTKIATVFYTGALSSDSIGSGTSTQYGIKKSGGSYSYNTSGFGHYYYDGNWVSIVENPGENASDEEKVMSAFYGMTQLEAAEYIVNEKLQPLCEAGVYLTVDTATMLEAFETAVNEFLKSTYYNPATNAVYYDVIPDYAQVVGTPEASMGSVEVKTDESVVIDGVTVTRDVVVWDIGTIPAEKQTMDYSIEVKNDKAYGIMDTSVQGVLTYDGCDYTVTQSPLVVQIDEIILAPKGADDYYIVKQGEALNADNNGIAGVRNNDEPLNKLIDTSGDKSDHLSIVQVETAAAAGLHGDRNAQALRPYTTEIVTQPEWGTVTLNEDGTFNYIQNEALWDEALAQFENDANGTAQYNASETGWEDSFTYKLVTAGEDLANYDVNANSAVTNASEAIESEVITAHIRIVPDTTSLTAEKSSVPEAGATVRSDDVLTYSIVVENPRSSAANDVVITDSAPHGTTLTGEYSEGAVVNGDTVTWTIDSIPAKGSATVWFKVDVDKELSGSGKLSNVASVSYRNIGDENETRIATNEVAHAYVTGVKSSDASAVLNCGDVFTYTITVSNIGSAAARNVVVTDDIPDGLSFVSSDDGSCAGGRFTAEIAEIAAGASVDVKFMVSVDVFKDAGTASFANVAKVNGISTNEVTDVAQHGTLVVNYVDKQREPLKSAEYFDGNVGETYTTGAKDIANYRLSSTEGSPSGSYIAGETVVTYIYERIPGKATIYYVTEDYQSIEKSESVSSWQGERVTDTKLKEIENYTFKTTEAETYTLTEDGIAIYHIYTLDPDLTLPTVVKSASPADGSTVVPGATIIYTISVTNNKYEAMSNVVISDELPDGTSFVESENGVLNGSAVTFTASEIPAGETLTFSFTVRVNDALSGSGNLENVAEVIYRDRNAATDSEVPSNPVCHAVVTGVKRADPNTFVGEGETVTYYITVTNNGSAAAKNVVVNDTVPEGTTLSANGGANVSGDLLSFTINSLEPGATRVFSFSVKVNDIDGYNSTIRNTATVNGTVTNEVVTDVQMGEVVVYWQSEEGVNLTAPVSYEGKVGTEHGSVAPIDIYGWAHTSTTGSTTGKFVNGRLEIINYYKQLEGDAVISYKNIDTNEEILTDKTIHGFVGDKLESIYKEDITNYNWVSTVKPEKLEIVEGTIYITHYYDWIEADETPLDFVKSANYPDGAILKSGDEVNYTLRVENTRVDSIYGLVISDYVPSGMTVVNSGEAEFNEQEQKLSWSFEELKPGEAVSVSFTARVNEDLLGKDNLKNTATISYKNRDLNPEGPVSSNTLSYAYLVSKLESFTDQPDANLTEGDTVYYKITTTNTGSAPLESVPVTSTIPDGTSFDDGQVNVNGNTVTTTIPDIQPGETVEIRFSVTVDRFPNGVYEEPIPNEATVASVPTNDVLDKAYVGTLTVKYLDYNSNELYPTETTRARVGSAYGPIEKKSFANRALDTVTGNLIGSYIKGAIEVVLRYKQIPATVTVRYIDIDTLEPVKNAKTDDGYFVGDEIPATYAAREDVEGYNYDHVETPAEMVFTGNTASIIHYYDRILDTDIPTVTKSSDPANGTLVKSGEQITYYIKVENIRAIDELVDVIITDSAPAGTTIVPGSASDNGDISGNNVEWTFKSIPAGESRTVSFKVTVDEEVNGTGNLSNQASVEYTDPESSETPEPVGSNIVAHAYLNSLKTSSTEAEYLSSGDRLIYTIEITNSGSAAAYDITVSDVLPTGLSYVSGDGICEGQTVTATIDEIQPGAVKSVSFVVSVDSFKNGTVEFRNTAMVNEEHTNTVVDVAKRGTVVVNYVDTARTKLLDSKTNDGAFGSSYGPFNAESINNYRHINTEGSASGYYTDGELVVTHIYERIPGNATIIYVDKDGNEIADPEYVTGYQGDTVTDMKVRAIPNYTFDKTEADSDTLTESGIVIKNIYTLDPDLTLPTVVKSVDNTGTIKVGQDLTYTISVTNNKYETMTDVVVTDKAPEGTTIKSVEGGKGKAGIASWTIDEIAAGATVSVSFTVTVDSELSGSGNLANTAVVSYRDRGQVDDTVVNSNTVTSPVLSFEKYSSVDELEWIGLGDSITYFIKVTNNGSAAARYITVTDKLSPTLSVTDARDGKSTGNIWFANIESLEPGATKLLSFTVKVIAENSITENMTITNTATVNGDNTNTVETEVKTGTVTVNWIDSKGNDLATPKTYKGKVGTVHGNVDALEFVGYSLLRTEGSTDGTFEDDPIVITHIYEKKAATATVQYIDIDNGKEIPGYDVKNFSGYVGDTLASDYKENIEGYIYKETVRPAALKFVEGNISIIHYYSRIQDTDTPTVIKSSNPENGTIAVSGQEITYTIEVNNVRKLDALTDVVVTDSAPAGTTIVDGSANENGVIDTETGTVVWSVDSIPAGESMRFSFKVIVNNELSGYNQLANTANVKYTDRQLGEEKAIPSTPIGHAYLVGTKSSSVPEGTILSEGGAISYTVSAENVGSAAAKNVVITDVLPEGTTLIRSTMSRGAVYNSETRTISLSFNEIAIGETAELKFDVTVSAMPEGTYTVSVRNTAKINGTNTGTTVNTAQTGKLITRYIDESGAALAESKSSKAPVGTAIVMPAEKSFYGYTLKRTEKTSDSATYIAGEIVVTYTYAKLTASATIRYIDINTKTPVSAEQKVEGFVGTALENDGYRNIEFYNYVETEKPDSLTLTEKGIVITHYYSYVPDTTELQRSKTASPEAGTIVAKGDEITYTITVTNPRRDAITNVSIIDTVPEGTSLVSADGAAINGDSLLWTYDRLAAEESKTVSFTVEVNSTFTEAVNLSNTATIKYTNEGEATENTLLTNTVNHAALVFSKEVDKAAAVPDDVLTYSIKIANAGACAANNITVTDELVGSSYVEGSARGARVTDNNGTLSFAIDSIAAGETVTISFEAVVDDIAEATSVISNTAYVNGKPSNTVETNIEQGVVLVFYVDENGTRFTDPVLKRGMVGTAYTSAPIEIPGYRYEEVTGAPPEGTFVAGELNVYYVYARDAGALVVNYVDEEGKALATPVTESFDIGKTVDNLYPKDITGYTLKNSSIPESLIMTEDGLTITYTYEMPVETYTVSGKVWLDELRDSTFTNGELLMNDILIKLVGENGSVVAELRSDTNGEFEFTNVAPGKYTVKFAIPSNHVPVAAIEYSAETINSIADEDGDTPEFTVADANVGNIGMGLKVGSSVAGDSSKGDYDSYYNDYVDEVKPDPVYNNDTSKGKDEVKYTNVLGESDSYNTGDGEYGNTIAVVLAASSLFVLILCKKKRYA